MRTWLAGLGAWSALALITAVQNYVFLDWAGQPIDAWTALWRELVMFGGWALLTPPIALAALRIHHRGGLAYALHAPLIVAAAFAHGLMMIGSRYVLPVDRELPPFGDQLRAMIGRTFVLDVVFYAAIVFVALAVTWARAYRRLSRAREEALRAQLQPHFLFNALHAVSSLIDTEPAAARRAIVRLSDLLRATLEVERATVTLEEELALLELYLDIQRLRFHDRLTVTIDVPAELRRAEVPPLSLQPLVENAIRHGIGTRPEPGTIAIAARRIGERVAISVADDGAGLAGAPAE
ncbi:MAG: histidine kinase, partial [Deltaproteobacteria bacterium]|nr:histidine kinase [Deltaproteobacteria bacterium]